MGTGTVTAGTASICGALAEGGHALLATVYDAAGNLVGAGAMGEGIAVALHAAGVGDVTCASTTSVSFVPLAMLGTDQIPFTAS